MKFNGSVKQNEWASSIILSAKLTEEQIDNLLRYSGPTLYNQGVMDVTIIIENRDKLAAYADSLGKFLKLSADGKHAVAEEACGMVRQIAKD